MRSKTTTRGLSIFAAIMFLTVVAFTCAAKREDFFIREKGTYYLDGKKALVEIYHAKNGKLNIRTVYPGSTMTGEDGWVDPNKDWFIYVESVNELWLSHDDKLCLIYDYKESSGIYSVNLYPNTVLKDKPLVMTVPQEVLDNLSPSALKKIKMAQQVVAPDR